MRSNVLRFSGEGPLGAVERTIEGPAGATADLFMSARRRDLSRPPSGSWRPFVRCNRLLASTMNDLDDRIARKRPALMFELRKGDGHARVRHNFLVVDASAVHVCEQSDVSNLPDQIRDRCLESLAALMSLRTTGPAPLRLQGTRDFGFRPTLTSVPLAIGGFILVGVSRKWSRVNIAGATTVGNREEDVGRRKEPHHRWVRKASYPEPFTPASEPLDKEPVFAGDADCHEVAHGTVCLANALLSGARDTACTLTPSQAAPTHASSRSARTRVIHLASTIPLAGRMSSHRVP
jgi:hypothetical protein